MSEQNRGINEGIGGGIDGGMDEGIDGGMDEGIDGGIDGGMDGGIDGGIDGGMDGGGRHQHFDLRSMTTITCEHTNEREEVSTNTVAKKRCSKCKTIKPIDCFGCNKRTPDGRCYYCKDCQKTLHNTPVRFCRRLVRSARSNSKIKRSGPIECTITYNDVIAQMERQNYRCFYSGMPMIFVQGAHWRASLERLNNNVGYIPSNIVLVCLEFNGVKQFNRTKVNFVKKFRDDITKDFVIPPIPPRIPYGTFGNDPKAQHFYKHNHFHGFVRYLLANSKGANSKRSKRRKQDEHNIDKDYLCEVIREQKGRCWLSGIPLVFAQKSDWQASLERLDESKGYVKGNVALICHEFNVGCCSRSGLQWSRKKIAFLRTFPLMPTGVLGKRERRTDLQSV